MWVGTYLDRPCVCCCECLPNVISDLIVKCIFCINVVAHLHIYKFKNACLVVCLFDHDLACFFLPSFSSLIKTFIYYSRDFSGLATYVYIICVYSEQSKNGKGDTSVRLPFTPPTYIHVHDTLYTHMQG